MEARDAVLAACSASAGLVAGGRYTFGRGPVNWATWNWDEHPYALLFAMPRYGMIPGAEEPFHHGSMTLLLAGRVRPRPGVRGADDEALEDFRDHAEEFLYRLGTAVRTDEGFEGQPAVAQVVTSPAPQCDELIGSDYGVQGLVVSVTLEY